jgi:hypothetical protein
VVSSNLEKMYRLKLSINFYRTDDAIHFAQNWQSQLVDTKSRATVKSRIVRLKDLKLKPSDTVADRKIGSLKATDCVGR